MHVICERRYRVCYGSADPQPAREAPAPHGRDPETPARYRDPDGRLIPSPHPRPTVLPRETVLPKATVGVRRVLAQLRPDTTRPRAARRTHQRSVHAARVILAHLDGTRRVTVRVEPPDLVRRLRHRGITAQRTLPIGVAALLLAASFASYLPARGGPTGGPTGDGPDVRLAIGGGFGLDGTGYVVDPELQGGIAKFGDATAAQPTRPLQFRPLVLEQVDMVRRRGRRADGRRLASEPVTGPFLADETLDQRLRPGHHRRGRQLARTRHDPRCR